MLSLTSTPIKSLTFHLCNMRRMSKACLRNRPTASKNKIELMTILRMSHANGSKLAVLTLGPHT